MQIFTANAHNFHATAKYVGATSRRVASRVSISASGGGRQGAMRGVGGTGVHCTAMLAGTRTTNALTAFSIYDPELFASLKWIRAFVLGFILGLFAIGFLLIEAVFCTCQLTL